MSTIADQRESIIIAPNTDGGEMNPMEAEILKLRREIEMRDTLMVIEKKRSASMGKKLAKVTQKLEKTENEVTVLKQIFAQEREHSGDYSDDEEDVTSGALRMDDRESQSSHAMVRSESLDEMNEAREMVRVLVDLTEQKPPRSKRAASVDSDGTSASYESTEPGSGSDGEGNLLKRMISYRKDSSGLLTSKPVKKRRRSSVADSIRRFIKGAPQPEDRLIKQSTVDEILSKDHRRTRELRLIETSYPQHPEGKAPTRRLEIWDDEPDATAPMVTIKSVEVVTMQHSRIPRELGVTGEDHVLHIEHDLVSEDQESDVKKAHYFQGAQKILREWKDDLLFSLLADD